MKELSLEYIAGYFDGEGCVSMSKESEPSRTYRISIVIETTYAPIVDFLQQRFGGIATNRTRYNWKTAYMWQLRASKDCLTFLRTIEPFSHEKHDQIVIAIQWLESQDPGYKGGPKPNYDLAAAEKCREQLRALKRGPTE